MINITDLKSIYKDIQIDEYIDTRLDDPKMNFLYEMIRPQEFHQLCQIFLGSSIFDWEDWQNPLTPEDISYIEEDLEKWQEKRKIGYEYRLETYNDELENAYLSQENEGQVHSLYCDQNNLLGVNQVNRQNDLITIQWMQQPSKFRLSQKEEDENIIKILKQNADKNVIVLKEILYFIENRNSDSSDDDEQVYRCYRTDGIRCADVKVSRVEEIKQTITSFVYFTQIKEMGIQFPVEEDLGNYSYVNDLERALAQCGYYAKRSFEARQIDKNMFPVIGFCSTNSGITQTGVYDAQNYKFRRGPQLYLHSPEQFSPVTMDEFLQFQKQTYIFQCGLIKQKYRGQDLPIRDVFQLIRKSVLKK